jgi:hypothetical protein
LTSKVGGGSGGLLRYEILLNNNNQLLHLEMKEQVVPGIYPVASAVPETRQRIITTLLMAQGLGASQFYKVVDLDGKSFLIRPRFAGNVGLNLDKQSDSENKEIIRYEAYTLGRIHSHSVKNINAWIQQLTPSKNQQWENDVQIMTDYFNWKYKHLTH